MRILQEKKEYATNALVNMPEDAHRDQMVRQIARVKVYTELLDLETLFDNEIQEE